jgi:hypothetical protein
VAEKRAATSSAEQKLRQLIESYRSILARYDRIESFSRRERELLRTGESMSLVNEMLHRKQELLSEIATEEVRVATLREWWKGARRTLPPAACEELLSLLDTIARRVEQTLGLEAECREMLTRAVSWGSRRTPSGVGGTAALAYGRHGVGGTR